MLFTLPTIKPSLNCIKKMNEKNKFQKSTKLRQSQTPCFCIEGFRKKYTKVF